MPLMTLYQLAITGKGSSLVWLQFGTDGTPRNTSILFRLQDIGITKCALRTHDHANTTLYQFNVNGFNGI